MAHKEAELWPDRICSMTCGPVVLVLGGRGGLQEVRGQKNAMTLVWRGFPEERERREREDASTHFVRFNFKLLFWAYLQNEFHLQ